MTAERDTRRSDAVWELLGDHLVELVELRRKVKTIAEYRDEVDELVYRGVRDVRANTVVRKLSEILNSKATS